MTHYLHQMTTISGKSSDFLDEMKLYFGGWVQDPMVVSISGVEMVGTAGECQSQCQLLRQTRPVHTRPV